MIQKNLVGDIWAEKKPQIYNGSHLLQSRCYSHRSGLQQLCSATACSHPEIQNHGVGTRPWGLLLGRRTGALWLCWLAVRLGAC